jgi:hypothetical protein
MWESLQLSLLEIPPRTNVKGGIPFVSPHSYVLSNQGKLPTSPSDIGSLYPEPDGILQLSL